MNKDVDIIITWVDGNDPKWKQDMRKHKPVKSGDEASEQKFRDWGTLKYIFRGIEKFMPWVRTVHFVTCGQIPKWLNIEHPQLHFVVHKDIFSDPSLLPTFSSSAIELNFLGIENLAEQFVYFNDDMLVLQPTEKERLFLDGKPRDFLIQTIPRRGWIYYTFFSSVAWRYNINNNVSLINKHFSKKRSIKKCKECYYNKIYGITGNVKNYISNLFTNYHYFEHYHQAQPFLKSVWREATEACRDEINLTSSHKFRERGDITGYLFRYWHLASGNFIPHFEKDFIIQDLQNLDNIGGICRLLKEDKFRFVCLNDESFEMDDGQFVEGKRMINEALNSILPSKSSYEK